MGDEIVIVAEKITKTEIVDLSQKRFGDMVKAVVDLKRGVMALGGELHADEERVLLDQGSKQDNLWGINIYHALPRGEWIEFDSMINIRPSQGNRSRGVDNENLRLQITELVNHLIVD